MFCSDECVKEVWTASTRIRTYRRVTRQAVHCGDALAIEIKVTDKKCQRLHKNNSSGNTATIASQADDVCQRGWHPFLIVHPLILPVVPCIIPVMSQRTYAQTGENPVTTRPEVNLQVSHTRKPAQ